MKTTLEIAQYAVAKHKEVNHLYDGKPYETHLQMVADYAEQFMYLIPERAQTIVRQAAWTHDLIEDCRETYNDVKKQCGEVVANITYALTNEKGKTRDERANDKYYKGIRDQSFATYIKICDRLANVAYSKEQDSSMFYKYRFENPKFLRQLHDPLYQEMFNELETLFYGSIAEKG